jgi:hypothetical protein
MYKWIQRAEKPSRHSDYTNLATQICRSNHSSMDFGQNQKEKFAGKMFRPLHVERRWLNVLLFGFFGRNPAM